jgi:hypothetical protein
MKLWDVPHSLPLRNFIRLKILGTFIVVYCARELKIANDLPWWNDDFFNIRPGNVRVHHYHCTSLPLYIITAVHHYSCTSLPLYIITAVHHYRCISLQLYIITAVYHYNCTSLPLYIITTTSLPLYIITTLHHYHYIITTISLPLPVQMLNSSFLRRIKRLLK